MAPIEGEISNIDFEDGEGQKPTLVLTVGLPRSGKSTWARQQDVPIVSPDAIRLSMHGKPFIPETEPWVWVVAKTMIRSLFLAGHNVVILDAVNHTQKRRRDWVNQSWRVVFKRFSPTTRPTPEYIVELQQRAAQTDRGDLITLISRMAEDWEPVYPSEGPCLK